MADPKQSIGGLWKKKTKAGNELLSGTIEIDGKKTKISVWPNKFKNEDKHPDYRIFIDDFVAKTKPFEDTPF